MDLWREFVTSSWGKEFVAGGLSGMVGVFSGHPLDTLRIRQQNSNSASAFTILRNMVVNEGPTVLFKGMAAPLASVSIQNAMVFQSYATFSRAFDSFAPSTEVPSYKSVAIGGTSAGALQSIVVSPVELIKIRLQSQTSTDHPTSNPPNTRTGPISVVKQVLKTEGVRGIFRGLNITILRDAPSYGFYFWTYEYTREQLHPGCRKTGDESFGTMLVAGGLAGVASWICCYPLDVVKTRLQANSKSSSSPTYHGIIDCFRQSVKQDGAGVLWRGFGTTVARAFVVNAAIFSSYEMVLRWFFRNRSIETED